MASPDFVSDVAALLYRHDPVGTNFSDNSDECSPEAGSIVAHLHRVLSVEDVRALMHQQFVHWFDEDTRGVRIATTA